MKRFILTGPPGAGKTAILRQLEIDGFGVIEEAATDLIALLQARGIDKPWLESSFIDAVAALQKERQLRAALFPDPIQFHDRSAVCTLALATFLGVPVTSGLAGELDRIRTEKIYQSRVFFIRSLGFIAPTPIRRISAEEALQFERIHEDTYSNLGFEILNVEPGSLAARAALIRNAVLPSVSGGM